jgi:hypothetical protein
MGPCHPDPRSNKEGKSGDRWYVDKDEPHAIIFAESNVQRSERLTATLEQKQKTKNSRAGPLAKLAEHQFLRSSLVRVKFPCYRDFMSSDILTH